MSSIGEKIAELRRKKGMTQEALAETIGVSAQSVSKWENNANMPDILLLPVIADIFEVSIDELYGRNKKKNWQTDTDTFEQCCEAMLDTIGASMYQATLYNLPGLNEPLQRPSEAEYIARQKNALKYAYEGKLRTAVISGAGIAYYRHKTGGLLIRRPEEHWVSLFEDKGAAKVLELIADRDFRTAIAELIRSEKLVFTIASLCEKCGIKNIESLEEKFMLSGMFAAKKVDVDGREIAVFELCSQDRMFLLFAILTCAREYDEHQAMYYGYSGNIDHIYD